MRRRCVNSPYTKSTDFGWVKDYPLNRDYNAPGKPGADYGFHTGVDYVSTDRLIVAPMDSVVSAKGYDSVNGNYLVLEANGYRDWFSHIQEYKVTTGSVKAGQALAVMGATGAATGVHVHHSLRVNGVLVDAEKYVTEVNMEKVSLSTARILAETILGRDRDYTHAGKGDADLNKNHVGKDLTNQYIMNLWTSSEAKAYAAQKAKDRVALATQTKRAEVAEKTLAEANKEIDRLKAQLAIQSDDTQLLNGFGETLRKLIIRLGLKG